MTLDESQFEDFVTGPGQDDEQIPASQQGRVQAHRAIRSRLQSAFASVPAPEGLEQRIAAGLAKASHTESNSSWRERTLRFPARLGAAAAIAAGLIIAVGVLWQLGTPSVASAQPEFFRIHQANLAGSGAFMPVSQPQDAGQRVSDMMQMPIALDHLPAEARVDGCAPRKVFDEKVASFRVALPQGQASIILLRRAVSDLGFGHQEQQAGRDFVMCRHKGCRMVAVRHGDLTYVAVSDKIEHDRLKQLLVEIVGPPQQD